MAMKIALNGGGCGEGLMVGDCIGRQWWMMKMFLDGSGGQGYSMAAAAFNHGNYG